MKKPDTKKQILYDHLCEVPIVGKFIKTASRIEVPKHWLEGEMENSCLMGIVSVWDDEKFRKKIVVIVA